MMKLIELEMLLGFSELAEVKEKKGFADKKKESKTKLFQMPLPIRLLGKT
jgi:hypothetical protein